MSGDQPPFIFDAISTYTSTTYLIAYVKECNEG
jgi:hypothetical protein